VQRIVVTSSGATVITVPQAKPTVYTEEDWNLSSIKMVEEMGKKSPPAVAYFASKTLAEKGGFTFRLLVLLSKYFLQSAAWDFYDQHKAQIKWDFTTILPGMVSFYFYFYIQK
jgi:hypothetical protein